MTKRLLLTVVLTFSVAAMYGQPLPALHVSEYDKSRTGIPVPTFYNDNQAIVEIRSTLDLTFDTQHEHQKEILFKIDVEGNGLKCYELRFTAANKYSYHNRKLRIYADNFEICTHSLEDLKAKTTMRLFVQSKADYYFNEEENYQEALREYYKLQSLDPNNAYVNSRIEVCRENIKIANNNPAIPPNTQTNPVTPQPNFPNETPPNIQPEISQSNSVNPQPSVQSEQVNQISSVMIKLVKTRMTGAEKLNKTFDLGDKILKEAGKNRK